MKKSILVIAGSIFLNVIFAQKTKIYDDPLEKFKDAKEFFQKEMYVHARPLFSDLKQSFTNEQLTVAPLIAQEINFYSLACNLMLNETLAETLALDYAAHEKNISKAEEMEYYLGEYYFRKQNFEQAIEHYGLSEIGNLSNEEISNKKFRLGYSYFYLQRFSQAKPLFYTISKMQKDPNYLDANYYYGFIAFKDKQYRDALSNFRIVENVDAYAKIVPYYIAQILYIQGNKEEALNYAEKKLKTGNAQYYDQEMKQMIGHAYFERKEFDKALPYLEQYIASSNKVRKEDLYELAYCYYQNNQLNQAIEGFKQLSGKEDSLSQNAMYLLGDAYLKTNQKANARNAFLFCSTNSSNKKQQEISTFLYAKLSYELGYQDEALNGFKQFIATYPNSAYVNESKDLLVDVLTKTSNYKDAQALLETMKNPTENAKRLYPRILYGRATELINDENINAAEILLDKALNDPYNQPVLALASYWKGEISYRKQELNGAIKYLNDYFENGSPISGEASPTTAKYTLGYVYLNKENYLVAADYFSKVVPTVSLTSEELDQDAYARLADCFFMQRDFAKAKSMYDRIIQFSWIDEDYATYQNAIMTGVRSPKEKISLLSTLIRKFPTSYLITDANMEIANTYMGDENFGDAIPYLTTVLKSGDAGIKPKAYLKLGTAYYNINNNDEALRHFNTLISQYPNSSEADDALYNIKAIYLEQGKANEYADFMRKVGKPLSVDTEDSLTFSVTEQKIASGNTAEAIKSLDNYLSKFPQGAYVLEAYFNKAELYLAAKDTKNALPNYEKVAANSPNEFAERATLEAARIYFFDLKNYEKAEAYYDQLAKIATTQNIKLEAMRGLLRSQYQLKKWNEAVENAKTLTETKGSSGEDKALAKMAIAKSHQVNRKYDMAIGEYKEVVALNKSALGAEARYEIASCWYTLGRYNDAEKAAFEVIQKSGSYDLWVTKSYLLLGDVYFANKDYFNAKATYQSVASNALDIDLKTEAENKLKKVKDEEARSSKIDN